MSTDDLRQRIADTIRAATCPGNCGQSEEECTRQRLQPVVWHHGVLAEVDGTPEQIADALLPLVLAERAVAISETVHDQDGAHPPFHRWRAEVLAGDTWMPASGTKTDRTEALAQLRAGERGRPRWDDGTPVQRRLVRETTTYTVEDTGAARADATEEQP